MQASLCGPQGQARLHLDLPLAPFSIKHAHIPDSGLRGFLSALRVLSTAGCAGMCYSLHGLLSMDGKINLKINGVGTNRQLFGNEKNNV